MKLEDQVCSLELAKKLKELGVKQDSLFNWVTLNKDSKLFDSHKEIHSEEYLNTLINGLVIFDRCDQSFFLCLDDYIHLSAFTVAELGEILYDFVIKSIYVIDYYLTYDGFNMTLNTEKNYGFQRVYIKDNLEANSRAKMLIYLIENNLMSIINVI